jgi:tetratricopeptide (TPR) repeat protein
LRRHDQHTLASIIAQGVRSSRWPEIHERFKRQVLEPQIAGEAARIQADVDRVYGRAFGLMREGKVADGLRLMAEDTRNQAKLLEEVAGRFPGWEKATPGDIHRFLGEMASVWDSLAEGKKPPRSTRSGDTLKAKALCDQPIVLWLGLDRAQSFRLFEQAVETDPACPYVRMRAGVFFSEDADRVEDAIRHLRVAIMLDPDESMAHCTLAVLLRQRDQVAEALEAIEPAAMRPDASSMAVLLRGELLLELGRAGEAEECFVSVLDREPWNSLALGGRASVCRARGDRTGEARFLRLATLHRGARPVQAFKKVG